ncbi:MAG: carboxypeptidase regulatory-like domain-containing protein [Bacteroidota bacterium]
MANYFKIGSVIVVLLLLAALLTIVQAQPRELQGGYFAGRVFLFWRHQHNSNPSSYKVYREGPSESAFSVIGTPTIAMFQDSNVTPSQAYQYYVTEIDTTESSPSETLTVHTTPRPPSPPAELEGEVSDSTLAMLQWQPPESHDSILYYKVYRAVLPETILSAFDSVTQTNDSDKSFNVHSPTLYAVTAVYQTGPTESRFSNIILLPHQHDGHGGNPGALQFTSTPPESVQVGQLYQYHPVVQTTPPNLHVCFSFEGPHTMTQDSTGTLTWTPDQAGIFEVQLNARICDTVEGEAEQHFNILVFSGNPGSISGTVQDQSSHGIGGVTIKLFDVGQEDFGMRTMTDSTGHYSFPAVNPSMYYIRARSDSGGFAPQWYSGATNIASATQVTVPPGGSVVANFTLLPADSTGPLFTISGVVSDTGGTHLGGAKVMVFFVSPPGHDNNQFDDGDHQRDHDAVQTGSTDQNGNYSLKVPAGNYIVGAFDDGYLPQFWDHKSSPLEATSIALQGDTGNINFNLKPIGTGHGIITGTIFSAADSSRLRSLVIGFQRTAPDSGFTGFSTSVHADSTGNYSLRGLPPGYYVVLAVPRGEFIPTFYNSAGGTVFHDSALAVASNNDSTGGINIYAQRDSVDGLNDLSGDVDSDTSHGSSGRQTNSLSPLAGVIVTITSVGSNTPLLSGITGTDGSYNIAGLGTGNFNVYFQAPGKTTTSVLAGIVYSNNTPTTTTLNAVLTNSGGPILPGLMNVQQGWNLVSDPVQGNTTNVAAIFPTAISAAYQYDPSTGYAGVLQFNYGQGYWLKFFSAQGLNPAGSQRTSQTINVKAGWNLIGSLSAPVDITTITTNPSGMIHSPYFGYSHGYKNAVSLVPGMGYWVKVTSDGSITMNAAGSAPKSAAVHDDLLTRLNTLKVTDASSNTQTLYFGSSTGTQNLEKYELPPVPPSGIFDARFSSDRFVIIPSDKQTEYPIQVQSNSKTLHFEWTVTDARNIYRLTDVKGVILGKGALSGNGSTDLVVSSSTKLYLKVESHNVPKAFALYQNYPNPFNPSTEIRFDLPSASPVTLKLYNVLGQEVATLLNSQPMDAGVQSLHFDASKLSSGVYFYRLQAGSFTNTKKMLLLK